MTSLNLNLLFCPSHICHLLYTRRKNCANVYLLGLNSWPTSLTTCLEWWSTLVGSKFTGCKCLQTAFWILLLPHDHRQTEADWGNRDKLRPANVWDLTSIIRSLTLHLLTEHFASGTKPSLNMQLLSVWRGDACWRAGVKNSPCSLCWVNELCHGNKGCDELWGHFAAS